MKIQKFHLYLADLNPTRGTEPGKIRPVVVVQSDLLNDAGHLSTIVCPLTTKVNKSQEILRVHIPKGHLSIEKDSDILIDQIRAIDNARLIKHLGSLSQILRKKLLDNLRIIICE